MQNPVDTWKTLLIFFIYSPPLPPRQGKTVDKFVNNAKFVPTHKESPTAIQKKGDPRGVAKGFAGWNGAALGIGASIQVNVDNPECQGSSSERCVGIQESG